MKIRRDGRLYRYTTGINRLLRKSIISPKDGAEVAGGALAVTIIYWSVGSGFLNLFAAIFLLGMFSTELLILAVICGASVIWWLQSRGLELETQEELEDRLKKQWISRELKNWSDHADFDAGPRH